jgi:hypothetical protein
MVSHKLFYIQKIIYLFFTYSNMKRNNNFKSSEVIKLKEITLLDYNGIFLSCIEKEDKLYTPQKVE